MARTYSGSALKPSLFTMRPRNFASDARKEHLSGFSLSPNFRRAVKKLFEGEYILPKCPSVDQVVVDIGRNVVTGCDRG